MPDPNSEANIASAAEGQTGGPNEDIAFAAANDNIDSKAAMIAVGLPPTPGFGTLFRFREGIERFFITDINNPASSSIPQTELAVMMDLVSTQVDEFNHIPGGVNVLFMDGQVEFEKYPGEYASKITALTTGVS